MKCKKLIAMGMAAVTALSLGVPALAEDTIITGMYEEIAIDVDIPTVGTAVINPYSMPVKAMYIPATGDPVSVGELTTAGKIATQPLIGISKCSVPLDVGATVTGTVKGGLTLATKDIGTAKTKSAVVYLECKADETLTSDNVTDTAADKPISGISGAEAVAAFNKWDATTYDWTTDTNNNDKVLVGATAKTKTGLCTLSAADEDGLPTKGGFMLARLGGDVVQNPTEAWTAKDGVVVKVSFSFTPTAPKTGGAITGAAAVADGKLVATVAAPSGVDFTAAKYTWSIVDAGTTAIDTVTDNGDGTADFESVEGTFAAGKVKVACTVTAASGIKYVTPATELTVSAT